MSEVAHAGREHWGYLSVELAQMQKGASGKVPDPQARACDKSRSGDGAPFEEIMRRVRDKAPKNGFRPGTNTTVPIARKWCSRPNVGGDALSGVFCACRRDQTRAKASKAALAVHSFRTRRVAQAAVYSREKNAVVSGELLRKNLVGQRVVEPTTGCPSQFGKTAVLALRADACTRVSRSAATRSSSCDSLSDARLAVWSSVQAVRSLVAADYDGGVGLMLF